MKSNSVRDARAIFAGLAAAAAIVAMAAISTAGLREFLFLMTCPLSLLFVILSVRTFAGRKRRKWLPNQSYMTDIVSGVTAIQ